MSPPASHDPSSSPVHANIGPKERAKRRIMGWLLLLLAGAALAWLLGTSQPWPWRLALAAPIGVGLLGVLQARAAT